jgi:hypothetical protein
MSKKLDSSLPSDIRLLLHADAEQHWLHREVLPVVRDLETHEALHEELLCAALAYLEAMWDEATLRARATDTAHAHMCSRGGSREALSAAAGRYHTAVRALRGIVAERVTPFVESLDDSECDRGLRVTDARLPGAGGCTPRAA